MKFTVQEIMGVAQEIVAQNKKEEEEEKLDAGYGAADFEEHSRKLATTSTTYSYLLSPTIATKEVVAETQVDYSIALVKDHLHRTNDAKMKKYSMPLAFDMVSAGATTTTCQAVDYVNECTAEGTTGGCLRMYGTYDTRATCSTGRVCQCGTSQCGCKYNVPPKCKAAKFVNQCTRVEDCRAKYVGAYDCKSEEGGVCHCGLAQVCGCVEASDDGQTRK